MAATANTISLKESKSASAFDDIFSKIQHVYFSANAIDSLASGVECDRELPILEDSVNFNTGGISKTEINLLDGTVWTSSETKDDSDISMQVASLSTEINTMFLTKKTTINSTTVMGTAGYTGSGWALDTKKCTGSLVMTDATGNSVVVLPKVEMTGSLVLGDGDNPAYFNVTVTPKANTNGDAIYILNK